MLSAVGDPLLELELWDGNEILPGVGETAGRIRIIDRPTLWKILLDPFYQFCEAYSNGRLLVEGSFPDVVVELRRAVNRAKPSGAIIGLLTKLLSRPRRNTMAASRDNIYHHYDIGNDFYRLWLDEAMVYTCAYFVDPNSSLEQAQRAKMDHVSRKLMLSAGEKVVEAGCGWGALALHMAKHYGVKVKAFNISREQIAFARDRARREGVSDRVEFIEDDWRNITQPCDVFVSVGMLEHVGLANYRQLGDVIHRCMCRNGRGLIHTIGQDFPHPVDRWTERRIFPGAYPPTLSQMGEIFQPHELTIVDVENLRPHYAETLWHWLVRFERSVERITEMFDERFVRMWRLYLAGSYAAFKTGGLQLFQVLFGRHHDGQFPRTRAYQYGVSATTSGAAHPPARNFARTPK